MMTVETQDTALPKAIDSYEHDLRRYPGAYRTLCELMDTCLVDESPLSLGLVINFLKNPEVVSDFEEWSARHAEARGLALLGQALSEVPGEDILTQLASSQLARRQFHGKLELLYLLALLAQEIPDVVPSDQRWLLRLKAWVFLHAFLCCKRKIRLEKNLQFISTQLRLGCEPGVDARKKLDFLLKLKPSGRFPVSLLDLYLQNCDSKIPTTWQLEPVERKLLNAICTISSGDYKELPHHSLPQSRVKDEYSELPEVGHAQKLDIDDQSVDLLCDDEGQTFLASHVPAEHATPAQRKLSTNSILMTSAEMAQHLPWSWSRPNPNEESKLRCKVEELLSEVSTDFSNALVGAILWSAITLGRNLNWVLAIRIHNSLAHEWQYDPELGAFRREPPMRRPGWKPDEVCLNWVEPVATEITVPVPNSVRAVFQKALQESSSAQTLEELWPTRNGADLRTRVGDILRMVSPRLKGGMLGEILPQRTFGLENDAVLARLISSHPQSVLSGAHSYARWTLEKVTSLLTGRSEPGALSTHLQIGLGSRLAVIDELLRRKLLESFHSVVAKRRAGDEIEFHNAYVAYVLLALFAATGARPIRSPFESLGCFDFEAELVYVDDKTSTAQERSGRVIPMPAGISAFLKKRYLPHLRGLAARLNDSNPILAQSISQVVAGSSHRVMPLFFFIGQKGDWQEVTPGLVFINANLDCPLQENFFRHRLANRLRAFDLDPEIIDGLLGHSEWGSETWGRLSFRTWKTDACSARVALGKAFKALGFRPLRGLPDAPPLSVTHKESTPKPLRPFGSEERERHRLQSFNTAVRDAKFIIEEFLKEKERELKDLDADDLARLSEKLTRKSSGMPYTNAGLRLSVLIRKLEKIESKTGKRHRPRTELIEFAQPPSVFSQKAAGALGMVARLNQAVKCANPKTLKDRRIVALVGLAVESRIANAQWLQKIAAGNEYRVIRLGDRYFLECGQSDHDKEVAGLRFPISSWVAGWLYQSRAVHLREENAPIPESLGCVFMELPAWPNSLKEALVEIAEIVEQANALEFPGVLAGYLSGQTQSAALGWVDTVRQQFRRKIEMPCEDEVNETDPISRLPASSENVERSSANNQLLERMTSSLREAKDAAQKLPEVRREMRAQLSLAKKDATKANASPSLLLLSQWICTLAEPLNGKRSLQPVTLLRYWGALCKRFASELADFDLLRADEESLTEAYSRVLLANNKLAGEYDAERLLHFHRWLGRNFGVESPAWEELPVSSGSLGVSPGFISPPEYLEALHRLKNERTLGEETRLAAGMVLLLAYRFGLRSKEALYLAREEWSRLDELTVVTVQNNRWRTLKTMSSRRQVPLVFELTEIEEEMIENMLDQYVTRHGDDPGQRLLNVEDSVDVPYVIRAVLKEVTGNPSITLHHARHSAANLVALGVTGLSLKGWHWPQTWKNPDQILLGRHVQASRRHGWAIARFMGHASPETTFKSYLHFMPEWVESLLTFSDGPRPLKLLDQIFRPDLLPERARSVSLLGRDEVKEHAASISGVLKAYRLFVRQFSVPRIASTLGYPVAEVERWLDILRGEKSERVMAICRGLSEQAWNRLISWSSELEKTKGKGQSTLPPLAWQEMVGLKNQLLHWRPQHFALLRAAVDMLELNEEQYTLYGSSELHVGTRGMAEEFGFKVSERPTMKQQSGQHGSRKLQIDSAYEGPYNERVNSRVAVIYRENSTEPIRNQPEFVLITVIIGVLMSSRQPEC